MRVNVPLGVLGTSRSVPFKRDMSQLLHQNGCLHTSYLAVPGVPLDINAREISRPVENICIILVQWASPTNIDISDIGQYIVYVPSRNIEMTVSSSSTLTTLTVPNCGDDIHVQVAAMNHFGCVGMNSSEVPLTLLDIPAGLTDDGSATTEDGSTSTSSKQFRLLPCAARGKAIGLSVCLFVCLSVYQYKNHQISMPSHLSEQPIHRDLQITYSLCFESFGKAHECHKHCVLLAMPINCTPMCFCSYAQYINLVLICT